MELKSNWPLYFLFRSFSSVYQVVRSHTVHLGRTLCAHSSVRVLDRKRKEGNLKFGLDRGMTSHNRLGKKSVTANVSSVRQHATKVQ